MWLVHVCSKVVTDFEWVYTQKLSHFYASGVEEIRNYTIITFIPKSKTSQSDLGRSLIPNAFSLRLPNRAIDEFPAARFHLIHVIPLHHVVDCV